MDKLKDNRLLKTQDHEIEDQLQRITDTEILMNFQEAITDLYSRLITIHAFCYDSWDEIVEHLYNKMVWQTFSWKYGVATSREYSHQYAFECPDQNKSYIECKPTKNKIRILRNFEWSDYQYSKNRRILFKEFADGIHFLTGTLTVEEAKSVTFHLVRADISSLDNSGLKEEIYLEVKDLEFEIVFVDV